MFNNLFTDIWYTHRDGCSKYIISFNEIEACYKLQIKNTGYLYNTNTNQQYPSWMQLLTCNDSFFPFCCLYYDKNSFMLDHFILFSVSFKLNVWKNYIPRHKQQWLLFAIIIQICYVNCKEIMIEYPQQVRNTFFFIKIVIYIQQLIVKHLKLKP